MSENTETPSITFHKTRDPLKCRSDREKHEFRGWREFEDNRGGEAVCKHCGVGAMSYTLAME